MLFTVDFKPITHRKMVIFAQILFKFVTIIKNNSGKVRNFAVMKFFRKILLPFFMLICMVDCHAIGIELDTIASWGKFPKFCIDVYRWGDKTFNSYDSTYVVGTGYKFKVIERNESWIDYYKFQFEDDQQMEMISDPCTSMGLHVSYLALSAGYDINVSKFFGGSEKARKRFDFGFSCSLIAANFYFISNDVGTEIKWYDKDRNKLFGPYSFDGINCSSWGLETYYFFNHNKYSQAAAFSYSKIQKKSAGSFFAGISYRQDDYNFDFSGEPEHIKALIPSSWENYSYKRLNRNYAFKLGYGYNFVFPHNWTLGLNISPIVGLRRGSIGDVELSKNALSFNNRINIGSAYNHKAWFVGLYGTWDLGFIKEKDHTFTTMMMSFTASVGFRFNLW